MDYRFNDLSPSRLFRFVEKPDDSERLILDTLEMVNFTHYFYRKLKEAEFQRIVFLTLDEGEKRFVLKTFDAFSWYSYKSYTKTQSCGFKSGDDDETLNRKIKPLVEDLKSNIDASRLPDANYGSFNLLYAEFGETIEQEIQKTWGPILTDRSLRTVFVIDMDWSVLIKQVNLYETMRSLYEIITHEGKKANPNKIIFLLSHNPSSLTDSLKYLSDIRFKHLFPLDEIQAIIKEQFGKPGLSAQTPAIPHPLVYPAPTFGKEDIQRLLIRKDLSGELPEGMAIDYSNLPSLAKKVFKQAMIRNPDVLLIDIDDGLGKGFYNLDSDGYNVNSNDQDVIPVNLNTLLKAKVIGQDPFIDRITELITHRFTVDTDSQNPVAILLFGASGIGKTRTFEALAEILKNETEGRWGTIRIDLNAFDSEASASGITGASPNYIGFGTKMPLDELKDHEYNLVLFDEFEKAHEKVISALMGIIRENGQYRISSTQRAISTRNTIFIFTSNIEIHTEMLRSKKKTSDQNAYLNREVVKVFKKRVSEHTVTETLGRIQLKLCYYGLPELTPLNQNLLFITLVLEDARILKERKLVLSEIDPKFIDRVLQLSLDDPSGSRNLKAIASSIQQSMINYTKQPMVAKHICLGGDPDHILITPVSHPTEDFLSDPKNAIARMRGYANWEEGESDQARIVQTNTEGNLIKHLNELNDMIGLESVKQSVEENIFAIRYLKKEQERNFDRDKRLYSHMIFTGNPGTGKTTIAELYSKILTDLGILESGVLVKSKKSDLVRSGQGDTSKRVREVCESAFGGVLFIDEFYALYNGPGDNVGIEAIDTLNELMEEHRDKFMVIAASYGDQRLKDVLSRNIGLSSRFEITLHFPDYSAKDLYEIFLGMVLKGDYFLENEALKDELLTRIEDAYPQRRRDFGNARDIRRYLNQVIGRLRTRVERNDIDGEARRMITREDLDQVDILKFFKTDATTFEEAAILNSNGLLL